MSKKPFVIFGLVVAFFMVVVPAWAFLRDGDPDRDQTQVPARLESGQSLFVDNCGNCHKLDAAGTYGDFGPDLDQRLAPAGIPDGPDAAGQIDGTKSQVLSAIEQGADDPTVPGRMPAGIVSGPVAEEIADFVAQSAGRG
jgi:mono/diheme cytochrome c family protein